MRTPILIINMKNYTEVSGDQAVRLAKAAEEVAGELSVEIAVAPPLPSLGQVVQAVSIPVLAQHTDPAKEGSTTGAIVPEMVKALGAAGSLVNHSEKRLPFEVIGETVHRLKGIGLTAVVCAKTSDEVAQITGLGPDFVAIEPPELIGSGIAVSKAQPEIVSRAVEAARKVDHSVRVICGAGIVTGEDVASALKLGSVGVLVASGIVKAVDWQDKIRELALPLQG
ncbi:MAG: triose-phosphate isomerase [Thaumarchaeota archaeon]|nr:triose-phosphate isomerase [Nitrososphaerota archaeon]MCL5317465.1 triose-phosphate isomerase [Nitrososphaerota archaeon]